MGLRPGSSPASSPGGHRTVWWLEPAVGAVVLNLLHGLGMVARGGVWPLDVTLACALVYVHPAVERRLLGDDRRSAGVWRAMAVGAALATSVAYLTGWGPVLGILIVLLAAMKLQSVGSRCWVPLMVSSVVAAAIGQVGVATGLIECYLPRASAQAVGLIGTAAVALAVRMLGLATEARESEAAARERVQIALSRSEDRFRALVQDSNDVITVVDAGGNPTYVSSAAEHVTGYPPEVYRDLVRDDLIHPEDRAASVAMAEALVRGATRYRAELRLRHADGSWHWHEVHARNLLQHPAVAGIVYNHRDITERKAYEQKLAYDASHDPLTGLANRVALLDALSAACNRSPEELCAVLYVDLDGFKRVNDEQGHQAGDAVLLATAQVLRECVPGSGTVGRLGGDEFAVVLNHIGTAGDAIAVAERIVARLGEPGVSGNLARTRASIGIAVGIPGTDDPIEALRRADVAMYRAKRDKATGWQLYDAAFEEQRDDCPALENDLRHTLDDLGTGLSPLRRLPELPGSPLTTRSANAH